ncbi:MAG: Gldg family protein [Candidatus Omnitrophica bacterium]|nr:Gldg family protein [Candidatus Omnitrophota bacterium]
MRNIDYWRAIFTREILSYFNSPIAYIFIVVFVVLNAGIFMSQFFLIGNADMRSFFNLMPVVLSVFIPAVTMRLWSEEKKGNTFEMLLTFPMKTWQLVLGKFLAAFLFFLITLAATLPVPVMLAATGHPDPGQIIGGYTGTVLMGAFFLGIGIFVSGLCKDQIVSFIVAMIVCFFFFLTGLDFIAGVIDGWVHGAGSFLMQNFGMTRHFDGFQRGVIDNRDVLYFVVMTAAFLVLNMFSIDDRLKPKARIVFSAAVGVCLAISVVLNVLFSDIPLGRQDMTEGKLYTVTATTKKILQGLKAPVTVKLYISPAEKMPTALRSLEQDIKDRLDELRVFAAGKLQYKIFHLEPADAGQKEGEETLADKMQQKGIRPFQVRSIEQDQMDIKLVYSAVSISYKEKEEEVIPAIMPANISNFEYELVSRIYRMTLDKIPTVAMVAPFTQRVVDPQMLALLRQLGQSAPDQYVDDKFKTLAAALQYEDYKFSRVRLTRENLLPEGLDTLIIVAPEKLNDRQRYEINRFLNAGGNVILAAQNYEYRYGRSGPTGIEISGERKDSNVNDLTGPYGIRVSDKMLLDERSDTISLSGAMSFGPFEVSVPVKAPMQILVDEESMNHNVSITGRLSPLLYLWGSALETDDKKFEELGLKKTVLLTTSKKSWTVPSRGTPLSGEDVRPDRTSYEADLPLAVLLEGQFPDAFKGQAVPAWPKEDAQAAAAESVVPPPSEEKIPALSPKPGKLLLVGCSRMFEEDMIKNGGMLNFFINSVDALTLGGELINIRGHQEVNRKVKSLSNAEKLWFRFMTILAVPCLFIILGSMRAFLRKEEKEQYLQLLPS